MVIKMKMGICDTTFARFDMATSAIDEIKGQIANITFVRTYSAWCKGPASGIEEAYRRGGL